jgi:hypothetical protein
MVNSFLILAVFARIEPQRPPRDYVHAADCCARDRLERGVALELRAHFDAHQVRDLNSPE